MKKATYEGRVGKVAYEYNDCGELVCLPKRDSLLIRANSIVFVECDLDFRLPNFLALRFNLQIRHVHRGLLLGTGPIIDPGYWGKLCIPLHNLTNADYSIPRSEGLIWIECTKTSGGDTSIGRTPFDDRNEGYWCISDLIRKAASSFNDEGDSVAIRSSIPVMATAARDASKNAEIRAEEAEKHAKKIEEQVGGIKRLYRRTSIIGGLVGIATIVSILFAAYTLVSNFFSNIQNTYEIFISRDDLETDRNKDEKMDHDVQKMMEEIGELRKRLLDLESKNSNAK